MKKFANSIIRFRLPLLVGIVLLTIFFAYELTKVKIDSDILNYLPQDDPVVILFREIGEKFGGNSLAIIALETQDVFNPATLARIDTITTRFQALPEISQVLSLTDILDIKKIPDGIEVGKLISRGRIPQDAEELQKLREYALSKEMYRDNLVSSNGRIALIIARVREGADKGEIAEKMKEIVQATKGDEKIYYAGIPFQMVFLTDIITGDLGKLIPLVSLLVILVLYLSFRSIRGVILPLATVLISAIWVLGIMTWMKIDLTIVSASIPVLLIAIGSAYGIHLISRYKEDTATQYEELKLDCIQRSTADIAPPIIMAAVTTLVGFLAFLFSYLTMINEFGVFASLGVFLAMVLSLIFIPVMLSYLSPWKPRLNAKKQHATWVTRFMDLIADQILAHDKLILMGGIAIIIAAIVLIPRLHREVNMVEYFKHDSEIRQAEDMMERDFGGSIPVQILVQGDIKDPLVLKQMYSFEKYLRTLPDINDPQSVADLIIELNEQMNDQHRIPDTREGVANLWVFIDGNKVMEQLVADNNTLAQIQAKIGTVSSTRMIAVVDSINQYLDMNVPEKLFRLNLAALPDSIRVKVLDHQLSQATQMILFDAEYHGVSQLDSNLVLSVLGTVDSPAVQHLDLQEIDTISQVLTAYFQSDAADIIIDDNSVIRNVVSGLSPLYTEFIPTEDQITSILRQKVPSQMYIDDPEAIEYAAIALKGIIAESRCRIIVDGLANKITELTSGISSAELPDFRKDIQGDIWTLVEDNTGLQSSQMRLAGLDESSIDDQVEFTTSQTGMPLIFKNLDSNILKSQIFSLLAAMTLVFLLLTIRFRSLIGGLISLAPITATILCNFVLMAILNIPVDAVSVLIGSVAVGIGVDYTIHFLTRFQKEFQSGKSEQEALRVTLETTGKAILINAFSVMMGFLVLIFGNIVPMQRFGYLLAFTMITSALGAITLLPALILVTKARFIGEFDSTIHNISHRINGIKSYTNMKNNFVKSQLKDK